MSITDDKAKFQKLEKAEILEMVVGHMRNIQMTGGAGNASDSGHENSASSANLGFYYAIAYRQCLNEFQSFLSVFPDVNDEFKARIMGYMTQRYMDIVASMNKSSSTTSSVDSSTTNATSTNVTVKKEKKPHSNRYSPYNTAHTNHSKQPKCTPKKEKDNLSILTNSNEQNISTASSSSSSSSSSSYNFYNQAAKYGGSCSSLDSYQAQTQPQSPSNDSTSSSSVDNQRHSDIHMSPSSSPVQSNCSSPNTALAAKQMLLAHSDLMFTNFELYQSCLMKVWRPW
jgi:hypothetical protein